MAILGDLCVYFGVLFPFLRNTASNVVAGTRAWRTTAINTQCTRRISRYGEQEM